MKTYTISFDHVGQLRLVNRNIEQICKTVQTVRSWAQKHPEMEVPYNSCLDSDIYVDLSRKLNERFAKRVVRTANNESIDNALDILMYLLHNFFKEYGIYKLTYIYHLQIVKKKAEKYVATVKQLVHAPVRHPRAQKKCKTYTNTYVMARS